MPESCVVYSLDRIPYQQAWDWQRRLAEEVAAGRHPPALLLLEHPHTFTFGRRGQAANLLWDTAELRRRDVQVLWVDRGGDVTYHGPGQLVGYPILPLAPGGLLAAPSTGPAQERIPRADYVGYLRRIEQALILALGRLGVPALARPGLTGVWLPSSPPNPPAKIASIGIKVDVRGVSQHGFALNVNPEMEYWQGIVACGLAGAPAASLAGLLTPCPSIAQVKALVAGEFAELFDYRLEWQYQIPFDIL